MNSFRDDLKLNVAAARLASAVYYAKAEAFGGEQCHWDALDVMTRHAYTERAAELLKTLQPKPSEPSSYFALAERLTRTAFATGLRTPDSNIVGSIGLTED